ncbi:MAG: adenylyl-sulfate kinase [Desulfovibrionaceae bacterium]|nr:adenylyl-sulfate kinase [Desulfovibrionaceae bacterium]
MQYSDSLPAHNAESLLVHFRRVELLKSQATDFKSVFLNPHQLCDLEMLVNRAYYPLDGYMCREDYESVLDGMQLADGTVWPLPICLGVDEAFAAGVEAGESIAIRDAEGFMLAVLTIGDVWQPDLEREARVIWGDDVPADGVNAAQCSAANPWYIGGRVEGLAFPQHYDFNELRLTPAELHRYFSEKGWRKVIGVQAGRALHKADRAMLEEIALEENASLVLSPLMFPSMYSSVDHFTLVRCLQEFVATFPKNMAMLNLMPWFERKMGPKGALLRAIVNKNYGCTHMLVWDSGKAEPRLNVDTDEFQKHVDWLAEQRDATGIVPIRERCMVLDEASGKYVSSDCGSLCVNDHNAVISFLKRGEEVPERMSFPGVLDALRMKYKPRSKQGFCLFFTGLSGAGKSTLAKVLYVKMLEMSGRPVTLLDGDVVRKNLSSELSFSKEHRDLNVTRIGFVASEIVKNGGVAVCAPIAPYAEARREVRRMIEEYGGFVEIHVSTPIEVCEQRDRKGIYAKARAGIIKGLTGVDDPYIAPENPELRIDTSELTPNEGAQVVLCFLADQKYLGQ